MPAILGRPLALLAALTALTACENPGGGDSGDQTPPSPDGVIAPKASDAKTDEGFPDEAVLTFADTWEEWLSAPVVAGHPLRIRYDLDRLPTCRGTQGGRPQWDITGYFSADGAPAQTFQVTRVEGEDRVAQDAVIEVPRADDLALWFSVSNRWGCIGWDSNYSTNYHVVVTTPDAEAVASFGPEGAPTVEGELVAGGTLRVRYDLGRLSDCQSGQGSAWSAQGHLRVDAGEERAFEITALEGETRVAAEAVLEVPAGQALALWFTASNRWGCFQGDGAAGDAYRLSVAQ